MELAKYKACICEGSAEEVTSSAATMRHKSITPKISALRSVRTATSSLLLGKHQHPQRALAARWGCLLRWF